MEGVGELWRRLLFRLQEGRMDRELEQEMQFHLEMKERENQDAGMAAQDARYAARRQFGNVVALSERSREAWGWPAFESAVKDVKLALRALRRNPGFSALAVLTLALGIGANTAVYSVVQAVLLRPLPFPDPERVVMVWDRRPVFGDDRTYHASSPQFFAWQTQTKSLESIAAMSGGSGLVNIADEPTEISGVSVSADFFRTMGVQPTEGRAFSDQELQAADPRVVILSHRMAQRLGGNMVGKTIRGGRASYLVVGVMPRRFTFPNECEIWYPLTAAQFAASGSGNHNYRIVARLKRGTGIPQAQSELRTIRWPGQGDRLLEAVESVSLVSVRQQIVGRSEKALGALLGVVACLLLIACVNVANLTLSRAAGRQREIALRLSLGASRARVVRYLLAESGVLAFAGGTLGLAAAYLGVHAFATSNPVGLPRVSEIAVDTGTLVFTLVAAVSTAVLVGLAPALRVSSVEVSAALKQSGPNVAGDTRSNRIRSSLAVAQVALAVVMLASSGLLLRSFVERISVPLGFRPTGLIGCELPWSVNRRIDELLERLRAIPGVQTAGAVTSFPQDEAATRGGFELEKHPHADEEAPMAGQMVVTQDYFRAAGLTLRRGRFTASTDGPDAPKVAVISESLARQYLPGEDPIGKRIRRGESWMTIVGVVGDVKGFSVDGAPLPAVYIPHRQVSWGNGVIVLMRTAVPPASLLATVRRELRAWNKTMLISRLAPVEVLMAESVAGPRFYMLFVGAFAAIAMLIAAVGVYGTLNYMVTQRTHEIGVRMALGAARGDLLGMIVGQGFAVVLAGMVLGLAGAWGFTRVLQTLLFRVKPSDATTFVATSLLLSCVGLIACYVPARRATRIDPLQALREE
jgi:putative ABC transport system permease protein